MLLSLVGKRRGVGILLLLQLVPLASPFIPPHQGRDPLHSKDSIPATPCQIEAHMGIGRGFKHSSRKFCEALSSTRPRKEPPSAAAGGSNGHDPGQSRSSSSSSPSKLPSAAASKPFDFELERGAALANEGDIHVNQLSDALTRITKVMPQSSKAFRSLAKDPRLRTLLRRINSDADKIPARTAPFLLSSLSKLPPSSLPPTLLSAIQTQIDGGLEELPPIALCTIAYTYSRLSYIPKGGLSWWNRFLEVTSNSLIDFSPWQISQLIRSLTVQPTTTFKKEDLLQPTFLTLALKCAERRLNSFTARDLEALVTTISKINHYKPEKGFLHQLTAAGYEALPTFPPHAISRFLHALSRLDFQPSIDHLQGFEVACFNTSSQWGENELALIMQAWSWLNYQPNEKTLVALLDRAQGILNKRQMSPLNLGTLVVGLGELRRCPSEEWMASFQAAASERFDEMGGKDLNYLLKGLSKLGWFPGEDFLLGLLAQMERALGSFNGPDLQFTITALVGLNYKPPLSFTEAFKASVLASLPTMNPRDLSIITWSFAALQIPDSKEFLSQLFRAVALQLTIEKPTWATMAPAEKWPSVARMRQLRQVLKSCEIDPELAGLLDEVQEIKLPELIDEGLALLADDNMVLSKAIESSFHVEVVELLSSLGAKTRKAVDIFLLDVLLEPTAAESQELPLLLLLHGPSRFLRHGYEGLEAGTSFKVRVLESQTHRFAKVTSITYQEWANEKTREGRITLLRRKIGPLLDSYVVNPTSDENLLQSPSAE